MGSIYVSFSLKTTENLEVIAEAGLSGPTNESDISKRS